MLVIFLTLIARVGAAHGVAKQQAGWIVPEMYSLLTGETTWTVETVSFLCTFGFIEYFSCYTAVNVSTLQWLDTIAGHWLKASNLTFYHTIWSLKTPSNPQMSNIFCVPHPSCPFIAAPAPFLCSFLGLLPICTGIIHSLSFIKPRGRVKGALQG